jgi:hypothetical protein
MCDKKAKQNNNTSSQPFIYLLYILLPICKYGTLMVDPPETTKPLSLGMLDPITIYDSKPILGIYAPYLFTNLVICPILYNEFLLVSGYFHTIKKT